MTPDNDLIPAGWKSQGLRSRFFIGVGELLLVMILIGVLLPAILV